MIREYGKACGIDTKLLHPHAFRHLFGAELAESDVDVITRQQLLGHSDPKSTEIYSRSEEHTSELQSLMRISYAVFCLKKKTKKYSKTTTTKQLQQQTQKLD